MIASQRSIHLQGAFETGWRALLNNWLWLVGLALAYLALEAVPYAIEHMAPHAWVFRLLASVLRLIGQTVFWTFAMMLCLALARKDGLAPKDFASQDVTGTKVVGMLLFALLYGLVVGAGLILLIVPGVIWALQFSMAPFYIVQENCDAIEAMRRSKALTRGQLWDLLLFYILCCVALGLGFMALVVGLVPAVLVTSVAQAKVFLDLSAANKDPQNSGSWTPS